MQDRSAPITQVGPAHYYTQPPKPDTEPVRLNPTFSHLRLDKLS